MNANQDLEPRVRVWLHERLSDRPDPYPILDEILSQLPTTPQRKHRWWPFGHRAASAGPAPGGATPSRGYTMFSALKFAVAAAVVALFGGVLLAGVLTTQQEDVVAPAAVSGSPAVTATHDPVSREVALVSGRVIDGSRVGYADVSYDDGTTRSVGDAWQMELSDMSDARLDGTYTIVWNMTTYNGIFNVMTATGRIDNEHGSWIGVERGYEHPGRGWNQQGLYEGQGAYEGLTALLFWEPGATGFHEVHGVIFPGEMPEALDAPSAVPSDE